MGGLGNKVSAVLAEKNQYKANNSRHTGSIFPHGTCSISLSQVWIGFGRYQRTHGKSFGRLILKTIVIDGATGMIGLAIIDACIKHGVETIYAISRENSKNASRLPKHPSIHVVECNADNYDHLPELIREGCDVFYHIAWTVTGGNRNVDIPGQETNIAFTLSALQAAKKLGCEKFVGAGSQAEYGLLDIDRISPDSPINPVQPYGIAKYAAGRLGSELAKQLEIDFLWVRIFSVFGENDKPTTMIASSIKKMMAGERASFTAGEQMWDYLYSADAGEAFYAVGEHATGNKIYCLGSGNSRSLKELIFAMRDIVNPNVELGIGDIPYKGNEVMSICADITRIQADTGWKPSFSFEAGIKRMLEHISTKE